MPTRISVRVFFGLFPRLEKFFTGNWKLVIGHWFFSENRISSYFSMVKEQSPISNDLAGAKHFLRVRSVTFQVVLFTLFIALPLKVGAQTKRKPFVPGQRAVVIEERLSALRTQADVKAPLEQRLRRGRVVGILGAKKGKDGQQFLRVAVSRKTRGWLLAEAVVKSGNAGEAERLLKLIEETNDDFVKARLARLCADEFRAGFQAPRCLLLLGEAAEHAADRLTRDAKRRVGDEEPSTGPGAGLSKRDYFLNFVALDRYNRAGVTFDYDERAERIVYDGEAYRELLRRYPKSAEAQAIRAKLSQK